MKLLIISHTEHYTDASGEIKGWGPTVREINFLATKFDEIVHVACLHDGLPLDSSFEYTSPKIKFIPLPPTGGKSFMSKLKGLLLAPLIVKRVYSAIRTADAIQLRVPTGIANYLLPALTVFRPKKLLWVKYAGNWKQENAPFGYRFQRWWLKNNFLKCKVTINGKWHDQPSHCITFENPCLDEQERIAGKHNIWKKKYFPPYTACFIGRVETEKGVKRIINALPIFARKNIVKIHFIGDGTERNLFSKMANDQNQVQCIFHGGVTRNIIPDILSKSHFLLLPSTASEGFPKVIAEGVNYGAIPIVSDIGSINQYINDDTGYVWNRNIDFNNWLESLAFSNEQLITKSKNGYKVAEYFTFEKYFHKLNSVVLDDN